MADEFDMIVIGAGASGLIAGKELCEASYKVCILEATDLPGGRISTRQVNGFDKALEMGAEFIHGHAPLTLQILKDAGITYEPDSRELIRVQNGVWQGEEGHGENFQLM